MKNCIKRFILAFLLIAVSIFLILILSFALYIASNMDSEIDENMFQVIGGDTASKVYYYENSVRGNVGEAIELEGQELYGGFRSKPQKYEEIPQNLIYAFVSIEDKRFFTHKGVDWKRTIGATLNYFLDFKDEFGGSTITQQLIKNVTEEDDYSLERKIQEILWALDLERKISKEEILENYLNIINLSNGCYGVGAASEYYFSKSISELTLNECAAIAAITNNPSYYDPARNPANNAARRRLILTEMYEQGYIGEEEYRSAYEEELMVSLDRNDERQVNMWYVDMVVNDVINDLISYKGYTRSMASMLIYTGGLKIYTAMDAKIQRIVEDYYKNVDNFYWKDNDGPQSSMIIIDPYTGDILAVAGAVGEKKANRIQNFATETVRPAGSVIKPLSVYAPALDKNIINWASVYDDVPVNFGNYNLDASKGTIVEPKAWPKNANGVYRGLTNINYAVEHSVNTVTVKVLEDLGLEESFTFLKSRLHLDSLIESKTLEDGRVISDCDYAALALGQFNYGVSLRDISAAYSIFANSGVYNDYRSYYKVTDAEGNIILEDRYKGEAVIKEETAMIMTKMLQNVVESGTASGIKLKENIDCAGKTGTTQSNFDRWFIGYTPYFIGGVWYGYEYPKSLSTNSNGICIEIWNDIMTELHKKYINSGESKEFICSDEIIEFEYCADSGKIATAACKKDARGDRREFGYFVRGSEPTEDCDCHVLVRYDNAEGGVASSDCPYESLEYVGLIKVERVFPKQVFVSDAQYVWRALPRGVMPETSPNLPFFNNIAKENEYLGLSYGGIQFNRFCRTHFDYFKWKDELQ